MYAVRLADGGFTVSSLRVHLAVIGAAHRLAGVILDPHHPWLAMVFEGISRAKGTRPRKRATAAGPATLRRVLASRLPAFTPLWARDRALLLLGFVGALRWSEFGDLSLSDVEAVPVPCQGAGCACSCAAPRSTSAAPARRSPSGPTPATVASAGHRARGPAGLPARGARQHGRGLGCGAATLCWDEQGGAPQPPEAVGQGGLAAGEESGPGRRDRGLGALLQALALLPQTRRPLAQQPDTGDLDGGQAGGAGLTERSRSRSAGVMAGVGRARLVRFEAGCRRGRTLIRGVTEHAAWCCGDHRRHSAWMQATIVLVSSLR